MHKNLKKMWPAIAFSLVTMTSMIQADTDSAQLRNLDNRVSALEQRKGASGMINPPGRPQVRDGVDMFLFGELLVWNAHENGLPVAVVNKGTPGTLSNSEVRGIHSQWTPGFRVGVGYNMPHDGWDLRLAWVRLFTHGRKNLNPHSTKQVFPSRVHPGDIVDDSPFASAKSRWNLHFNQLDLDLGREFFVSKWLTLRPHFGLRTDWIHQTWNTKASGAITQCKANYKDGWWGLGLEGGLDTQWSLGSGWSLFGDLGTAIVYGFHDLRYKNKDQGVPAFADVTNSYRISHPVLDMMMGLRYDYMFSNDSFHLGLELGWEHHVYFSQNQFPVFTDALSLGNFVQNQGDLTFQGWTLGARFDF